MSTQASLVPQALRREETVPLLAKSGELATARLTTEMDLTAPHGSRRACIVRIEAPNLQAEGRGWDFFEALLKLRRRVEPRGWRLLCYGASRNVWPSGMGRDMGLGVMAYRMQLGAPTTRDDLVYIFASGEDVVPCTVREQIEFRDSWWESHGARPGLWRRLLRLFRNATTPRVDT